MPATRTVTVACKIPSGIILEVFPRLPEYKDLPFGPDGKTKEVPQEYKRPKGRLVLKGFSKPVGSDIEDPVMLGGGYALTPDVDAELWEEWLFQNQHTAMVENRMIFAQGKTADAKAQGVEQKALKSNLEPMIDKDPRTPRGSQGLKVERDTAKAA